MRNTVEIDTLMNAVRYAAQNSPFYQKIYSEKNVDMDRLQTFEDFEELPFSDKHELRDAYPLGLQAVPDDEVIRIHSSSGTTGNPVIIPYTREDVENWAIMFARCYELAGITKLDRVQITPAMACGRRELVFKRAVKGLVQWLFPLDRGTLRNSCR